ncbi:CRP-like cAMP-binding protein [Bradyrhizobium sp. R2.2-H]|jgi:CRP-like cAMP-binding protein|uniref:Crp/Fnr family transcriptional regulator n=1 Tax=unclassified Bradyrhizobium TaxID=2631580 RepID=UPI00104448CF|nr:MULTISPECIES: Crp/Fnr family transcriptional regulator [unclassified Bradyrhizobium]TCU78350.1 CRP-like cAMP-binding protein [Bradyrhizobium sp. Y-H1]TCU80434.1 CRP-like cAMP-binding protein [Bradyrhizobium sp. R2.2-H]
MPSQILIKRLQTVVGLSEQDRTKLANMPHTVKEFTDGQHIVREGDRASRCAIVMSGFVFRQKLVGTRAQILSIYLAGDMPDLQTLHLPLMDHNICSAGPSTVGFVPHTYLNEILTDSSRLIHALWRETLVDAAIHREWIAGLARDARSRVGHLICELAARLEVVKLLKDASFYLPFTQQNIADACGLSIVHVNRTIQELRQLRLIEWERRTLTLLRRKELEELADFTPEYLHLTAGATMGASSFGSRP